MYLLILIILIILISVIIFAWNTVSGNCILDRCVPSDTLNNNCITDFDRRNFELEFLKKVQDPEFYDKLLRDPKVVLEKQLSKYLKRPFTFDENVNVRVIQEEPNDLYLLIPSRRELPIDGGPLNQIMDALNEKTTWGLFMSNYRGIWWRLGTHAGSCISDINDEVDRIYQGTQLANCTCENQDPRY